MQTGKPGVPRVVVNEQTFQRQVLDLARLAGWTHRYHVFNSKRSESGFPDLVMVNVRFRRVIFAELKSERGRITPAQRSWYEALNHAGGEAWIWRPSDWPTIQRVLTRKDPRT